MAGFCPAGVDAAFDAPGVAYLDVADEHFEDRLIERIALKETVRRRLDPRQRRVLCGRLEGRTFDELATEFRLSRERIRQTERVALARVCGAGGVDGVMRQPAPRKTKHPEPNAFDLEAFLEHMRTLIKRRDERRARQLEEAARERAERYEWATRSLESMLEGEAKRERESEQEKLAQKIAAAERERREAEQRQLQALAEQAREREREYRLHPEGPLVRLGTGLLRVLRQELVGRAWGLTTLGRETASVAFSRLSGDVTEAARWLMPVIPQGARLSLAENPIPEGTVGVHATDQHGSVRVIDIGNHQVRCEVTFDPGLPGGEGVVA